MELATMKIMVAFLAFLILIYSIVTFIYIDPSTGKPRPTVDNSVKGMLYLGLSCVLAYNVAMD